MTLTHTDYEICAV